MRRVMAGAGATLLAAATAIHAQQGGMDPKARAAIEQMAAAYKSLDALHVKVGWSARYTGDMSRDDFPLPGPDALEVRMQRPNKFYLAATARRDGKSFSYLIVCDGENLWHWRSVPNAYRQVKAPATLREMPKLLPDDAIGTFDGSTWSIDSILEWDLLVTGDNPMKDITTPGVTITMGPQQRVGNVPVEVLRMAAPASPLMPISTETSMMLDVASHLVRGFLLMVRGKNPDTGKDFSVTMQSTYEVLTAMPKFGPTDFTFTPPKGAKKIG